MNKFLNIISAGFFLPCLATTITYFSIALINPSILTTLVLGIASLVTAHQYKYFRAFVKGN